MQMRFDGKLGFPGGLVEPGEDIVAGLNRELVEEINLDITKHSIKKGDFVFCHYIPSEDDQTKSSRIRIFFAKEVTKSDFEIIEKRSLDAKEFGYEVGIYILYSILEYISSLLENFQACGISPEIQTFLFKLQSLGQFRVPLYIYKETFGFPKFLSSTCFAGGATKVQLLLALYAKKLITFEELTYVYQQQKISLPDNNI